MTSKEEKERLSLAMLVGLGLWTGGLLVAMGWAGLGIGIGTSILFVVLFGHLRGESNMTSTEEASAITALLLVGCVLWTIGMTVVLGSGGFFIGAGTSLFAIVTFWLSITTLDYLEAKSATGK